MRGAWVLGGLWLLLSACAAGPGPLVQSCEEWGLVPGTPAYQRCLNAKQARENAGARAAFDTVRSVDVINSAR